MARVKLGIEREPTNVLIGEPKEEEALRLSRLLLPGPGSREALNIASESDVRKRQGVGLVGPEKAEAALRLSKLQNPVEQLILTPAQKASPEREEAVLSRRASTEALLGLTQGSISKVGGEFGPVTEAFASGSGTGPIGKALRAEGAFDDVQIFQSIEDFELSPSQRKRYDELVAKGEIDPNRVFAASRRQSTEDGLANLQRFLEPIAFSRGGLFSGLSGSGITVDQAIEIVVGNDREGVSRFNPVTGFTWTADEIRAANEYARLYQQYQGFASTGFNRLRPTSQGSQLEDLLSFQKVPEGEFGTNRFGARKERRREDELLNALTLEELIQVQELVTGRSRRVGNTRRSAQPQPTLSQTLL